MLGEKIQAPGLLKPPAYRSVQVRTQARQSFIMSCLQNCYCLCFSLYFDIIGGFGIAQVGVMRAACIAQFCIMGTAWWLGIGAVTA